LLRLPQPIINRQNIDPRIRPSERDLRSTPVPLVDFLSHGSFCMVKRKWVRFGIISIEEKFGQVLERCIRVNAAGHAINLLGYFRLRIENDCLYGVDSVTGSYNR
jgi:hypothetical protein